MSTRRSPDAHSRRRWAGWLDCPPWCRLPCLFVLLLIAALPKAGAADDDRRADRARQQRDLAARFDTEERACRQQFVVTACVDDVRSRRRAALKPLRDEELRIEEADRRRQAEARRAAVAQKQRALAERGDEPPARTPAAPASGPEQRGPWRAPPATGPDESRAAAAARAQSAERRQAQAIEAQQRIARKQAEQREKGKAAAALPDPSAASAPRR